MNPDVFITIVFVGIAVGAALVGLVFVVPSVRREGVGAARRAQRPTPGAQAAQGSALENESAAAKAKDDAAVH